MSQFQSKERPSTYECPNWIVNADRNSQNLSLKGDLLVNSTEISATIEKIEILPVFPVTTLSIST
jgi:hypothetical protein